MAFMKESIYSGGFLFQAGTLILTAKIVVVN